MSFECDGPGLTTPFRAGEYKAISSKTGQDSSKSDKTRGSFRDHDPIQSLGPNR